MKTNKRAFCGWCLITITFGLLLGQARAQSPPTSLTVSNQIVIAGDTAVFGVSVTGAGPFTYQWLFNGIPINLITTMAGNYDLGGNFSGDGGLATAAGLSYPSGLALDGSNNLFIADVFNNVVRKVDAGGVITTAAGNYLFGGTYSGDGGAATNAGLNILNGVAVDASGNLFIADTLNEVIRKVDPNGLITTIAGDYDIGGNYYGDGGPATNAALNFPQGITVDEGGRKGGRRSCR